MTPVTSLGTRQRTPDLSDTIKAELGLAKAAGAVPYSAIYRSASRV